MEELCVVQNTLTCTGRIKLELFIKLDLLVTSANVMYWWPSHGITSLIFTEISSVA